MVFDPVVLILGQWPKEMTWNTERSLCSRMLAEALFVIKNKKQHLDVHSKELVK